MEGPGELRRAAGRMADPLAAHRRDRSPAELLARARHDGRSRPRERAGHGRQPRRSAGRARPVARGDRRFRSCSTRPAACAEAAPRLTRDYAYLRKLGTYTKDAQNWLVDDKWQYQRMKNLQTGHPLSSNWERRIPAIYTLAEAPASLMNSYIQAAEAIANAPFAAQLQPLDNDPDFLYYQSLFGWGGSPPDFQPRFRQLCTTDRTKTAASVQNLVNRIQGGNQGAAPHSQHGGGDGPDVPFVVRARPGGFAKHRQVQSVFANAARRPSRRFRSCNRTSPRCSRQCKRSLRPKRRSRAANRSFLPEWTNTHGIAERRDVFVSSDRISPSQQDGPASAKDPPSLGRLARRISRWTTNSLLTAMLLVIALGFGREVLHWWHDDAGPRPLAVSGSSAAAPSGADSQESCLRRSKVVDPTEGVFRTAGRSFGRAGIVLSPGSFRRSAARRGGRRRRAGRSKAARRGKARCREPRCWRLYQWSEGCPIVVGVRMRASGGRHAERACYLEDEPCGTTLSRGNLGYGGSGRGEGLDVVRFSAGRRRIRTRKRWRRDSASARRTAVGVDPRRRRRLDHGLCRRRRPGQCRTAVLRPLVCRARLDGNSPMAANVGRLAGAV